MRILHVIDTLQIGGAERVLVDLCNILHTHGHDVAVLIFTEDMPLSKYLISEINLISLKRRSKLDIASIFRLNRICSEYDIIHVHLRYNFRYVALVKYMLRGKYKLLLHDHFGDIEQDKRVPFGLKFFLRREGEFIGVSQSLVAWAVDQIGLDRSKCFLLSNIVVKNTYGKKKELNSGPLRILMVSNFRPSKNYEFAVSLLKEMIHSSFDFQISWVGQVTDQMYFQIIKERIVEGGIESKIKIIHDCDDVQLLTYDHDLAIHCAHLESGPLVLIEYLAQGLPFVAYRTGQVADQLSAYLPEFFVENYNKGIWIERFQMIRNRNEEWREILSKIYDELYSPEVYLRKVIDIYNSIISKSK